MDNLKTNKAVGYDRVSNEMIKNSPLEIKNMLLKYFNVCLRNGMVSEMICYDLINPIHKEGSVDDPNNYRGICISSALLKLMCSMINNSLQICVDKNGMLNKIKLVSGNIVERLITY